MGEATVALDEDVLGVHDDFLGFARIREKGVNGFLADQALGDRMPATWARALQVEKPSAAFRRHGLNVQFADASIPFLRCPPARMQDDGWFAHVKPLYPPPKRNASASPHAQ